MFRKSLYAIAVLALVFMTWNIVEYYSYKTHRETTIQEHGIKTTEKLRNQVDSILQQIVLEGNRLAEIFGSQELSKEQVESLIKKSSISISGLQGVTACYEPDAFSNSQKLYCPYYNKGTQDFLMVDESYDYSALGPGTAWYTSVRDEGAKWVEPYFAKAAKDWYIDYGVPFHYTTGSKKGQVRGTITMSFVASGFKSIVHDLSLGKTGYGVITSSKGTFLSHPINEYVGVKNIKETIKEESNQSLIVGYQKMIDGDKGHTEYYDPGHKDKTLFFYDQIPTSKWGMGVTFFKNDLLNDRVEMNHRYISISLWVSLFLFMLIAIYFNKDHLDRTEIWQLSGLSSLLLIANIVLIGYLQHKSIRPDDIAQGPPIVDNTALSGFVNQQIQKATKLKSPVPIEVPTGIYIQRLEFEDSYNLNVGGTVWQKYPLDKINDIKIGFTFPQMSPFAEAAYIEESYRDTISSNENDGYLLVGWDVRVTLRLNLQYQDYPFDKRHLAIKLAPIHRGSNLLFTPDLSSYKYTNPSQKSGLDGNIKISGNKILESYYNYSIENYDSDFGYGGTTAAFEDVPVLGFNIHLRRLLLNAFVTYLIPIFVCLIMIFILILACGKTDERQGIIESMAAFFFVLIFSHIDLRKEVITADLIYMEYFYFITYFIIILATFNLITYAKNKSPLFDYNENQIFKAAYFPLFFLVLLIVTLNKFY